MKEALKILALGFLILATLAVAEWAAGPQPRFDGVWLGGYKDGLPSLGAKK